MGSKRKDIPRLNGSALECNMEMELEIPPAKGSRGGKVITFSRMEKPRSTSGLDVGSSFGDQGIGNEEDPRLPGENDEEEEEYGHLEERGDEYLEDLDHGIEIEDDFSNYSEDSTEAEESDEEIEDQGIHDLPSITVVQGNEEIVDDSKGKKILEDQTEDVLIKQEDNTGTSNPRISKRIKRSNSKYQDFY